MAAPGSVAADPAAALLFTVGTLDASTRAVTWFYQVRVAGG
jgi:hypothetical protein